MIKSAWILVGRLVFKTAILLLIMQIQPLPIFARSSLKVKKIAIEGNKALSDRELKKVLKSAEGKEFNRRFLKLDQILLQNYYELHGYRDCYVSGSFRKAEGTITLLYRIREGSRYFLKTIRFFGNDIISDSQLRQRFHIADGAAYERAAIDAALNDMENYYLDHGKPYAVFSDKEDIVEDSLIVLSVYIQEGETVYIKDIEYEGLQLVKSFLIRRELEIRKGDIFSRKRIEASQKNIYSTGLFQFVNYRLQPIQGEQDRALLVWQVVEKKPLWLGLRFGVSYENAVTGSRGNVTTFDVTAETGHRNLFGTARSISFRIIPSFFYGREREGLPRTLSNPRNRYSFSYIEPWVFNTRTPGIFQISYSQEEPPISTERLEIFSTSFNITHSFDNFWSYTAGISFQRVNTERDSLLNVLSGGQDLIYSLSIVPLRDKRDNVINPQKGHLTEFRNKIVYSTSPIIESRTGNKSSITNTFVRIIAQWNRYQPFSLHRKWVLATRLQGGGLLEIGRKRDIRAIPVTERFYLGGASTVRGYAEQSIGGSEIRADGTRVPLGGKYLFLANAELRFKLFWLFNGEIFIDIGNIWEAFSDIRPLSLKAGSGAGLALMTPFGPIRFDYGIKMFPGEQERLGEFHLGIAFAF